MALAGAVALMSFLVYDAWGTYRDAAAADNGPIRTFLIGAALCLAIYSVGDVLTVWRWRYNILIVPLLALLALGSSWLVADTRKAIERLACNQEQIGLNAQRALDQFDRSGRGMGDMSKAELDWYKACSTWNQRNPNDPL